MPVNVPVLNAQVNQQGLINLVATLRSATKNANILAKAVNSINAPLGRITNLNDFEKSMSAAAARVGTFTATTSLIYGFADALRRLTSDALEFESSFKRIQSITNQTDGELKAISKTLFDLSNKAGVAYFDTAKAFEELSRQGLTVNKTIKATSAALTIAKLSGSNLKTTIDGLISTTQAYIDSGIGFDEISDKIVALDSASTATGDGIIQALSRVASVAKDTGFAFDSIAATVTALKQQTGATEAVIGNSLKTIITSLQSDKIRTILDGIGISSKTATGEFRDMDDVLRDLASKFNELSDAQKAFVGEKIAGKFQINRFRALLDVFNNGLVDKQIAESQGANGIAEKRLKIITSSAESELQKMQNSFTGIAASLSDTFFVPLVGKFTETIQKIFSEFSSLDGYLSKIFPKTKEAEEAGFSLGESFIDGLASSISGPGVILAISAFAKLLKVTTSNFGSGVSGLLFGSQEKSLNEQKKVNDFINQSIEKGNFDLLERLGILNKILLVSKGISPEYAMSAGVDYSSLLNRRQNSIVSKASNLEQSVRAKSLANFAGGNIPENLINKEISDAREAGYNITKSDVKMARLKIDGKYQDVVFNKKESIIPTSDDTIILPPNFAGGKSRKNRRRDRYSQTPYNRSENKGFIDEGLSQFYDEIDNPLIKKPPLNKSFQDSIDKMIESNNQSSEEIGSLANEINKFRDQLSKIAFDRFKIPSDVGVAGIQGATQSFFGKTKNTNAQYNMYSGNASGPSFGGTGGGIPVFNRANIKVGPFLPVKITPNHGIPIPTSIRNAMPTSPFVPTPVPPPPVPPTPLPPINNRLPQLVPGQIYAPFSGNSSGPTQAMPNQNNNLNQQSYHSQKFLTDKADQIFELKKALESKKYRIGSKSADKLVDSYLDSSTFSKAERLQQKAEARKLFREKRQSRNLQASFAAPFAAQLAINATGNSETSGGRIAGGIVEAAGSGLAIGSLTGGPIGAGIGVFVGAVQAASVVIDEWSGSSAQASVELKKFSETTVKTKNALDTYNNAFSNLSSLRSSGAGIGAIKNAEAEKVSALSQISDSKIREQLLLADTQDKVAEVSRKYQFQTLREGAALDGKATLRKYIDDKGGFLDKTKNFFSSSSGKIDLDNATKNEILTSIVSSIDFSSLSDSDLSKIQAGDLSSIQGSLPKGLGELLREISGKTKTDIEPELNSRLADMALSMQEIVKQSKDSKKTFDAQLGYEAVIEDSINKISLNFTKSIISANSEISIFKKILDQSSNSLSELGKLENDYYISKKEREVRYFEETQKLFEKLPTELLSSISGIEGAGDRLSILNSLKDSQQSGNFGAVIDRIKSLNDTSVASGLSSSLKDILSGIESSASSFKAESNLLSRSFSLDKDALRRNQASEIFNKNVDNPSNSGLTIANGISRSITPTDKKVIDSRRYRSSLGPKSAAKVAREIAEDRVSASEAIIKAQKEKEASGTDYKSIFPFLNKDEQSRLAPVIEKDKNAYQNALFNKKNFDQQKLEEPILAKLLEDVNSTVSKVSGRKNNIDASKYLDMFSSGKVGEILPTLEKSLITSRGTSLKDLNPDLYNQIDAFSAVSRAKNSANFEGAKQEAESAFSTSNNNSSLDSQKLNIESAIKSLASNQSPLISSQKSLTVSIDSLRESFTRYLTNQEVSKTIGDFNSSISDRVLDQATKDQGTRLKGAFNLVEGSGLDTFGSRLQNLLSNDKVNFFTKQQQAKDLIKEYGGESSIVSKIAQAGESKGGIFNDFAKFLVQEIKGISGGRITSTTTGQSQSLQSINTAIADLSKLTQNISAKISHDVTNQVTIDVNGMAGIQQKTKEEIEAIIKDKVKQIVIDLLSQNGIVLSEKPKV